MLIRKTYYDNRTPEKLLQKRLVEAKLFAAKITLMQINAESGLTDRSGNSIIALKGTDYSTRNERGQFTGSVPHGGSSGGGSGGGSSGESGSNSADTTVSESGISGKHDQQTEENKVDLEYLKSDEYKSKFKGITDNEEVNEQIYRQSKAILTHRNGTDKEDLILIDSITGKISGKQCNSQIDFGIEYNKSVTEAVKRSQPYSLISIHNHSTNNPPTGSDLVSNGANKYKLGVVVTHNGKVFTYRAGQMPFSAESFGMRVDKYRSLNYNEYDAIIRTLLDYSVQYGIEWSER